MPNGDNALPKHGTGKDSAVRLISIVLSLCVLGGALIRVFWQDDAFAKRFDRETLIYFAVAGALLLLNNLKSFSLGDYKVEFERVERKAEVAMANAANAQSMVLGTGKDPERGSAKVDTMKRTSSGYRGGGFPPPGTFKGKTGSSYPANEAKIALDNEPMTSGRLNLNGSEPVAAADDPRKGNFGGSSSRNNRVLEGSVTSDSKDWFKIRLTVKSTLESKPLAGDVRFYLHPTFLNDSPVIGVGPGGVAELNLIAWGAFTVGAIADDGKTKLELDLSELENAPQEFRGR